MHILQLMFHILHTALLIVSSPPHIPTSIVAAMELLVSSALFRHFLPEWWALNHTQCCCCWIMGQPKLIIAIHEVHPRSGSTITHYAQNDVMWRKMPTQPPTLQYKLFGWDLKKGLQASGKVKEASVIAVNYLGGKNVCSRSLCTLLWSTWAWNCSPFHATKPQVHCPSTAGRVGLSACVFVHWTLFDFGSGAFVGVVVDVYLCLEWQGCVSAGRLHAPLTDWVSKRSSVCRLHL